MNKELTQHECPKVFRLLKNGFNQNVFTGAQFGLWSEDYRHHFYHGFIGEKHQEEDTKYPQGENRLITSQTIFDISSLTKVISTTTLCALLV